MINLAGKHILIVEDEDMNFVYLKQIFKLTQGTTERVKTGQAAIDACSTTQYDLILMDIQLPDMSGIQATKTIRSFNADVPIIAQTACRTPDELSKVKEAGCNDVLVKPFNINDFSEKLSPYL